MLITTLQDKHAYYSHLTGEETGMKRFGNLPQSRQARSDGAGLQIQAVQLKPPCFTHSNIHHQDNLQNPQDKSNSRCLSVTGPPCPGAALPPPAGTHVVVPLYLDLPTPLTPLLQNMMGKSNNHSVRL